MRVVTVVGNRPQFVKAAAVSRPLREHHDELLVHTEQHYDDDMSKVFFDELPVPQPDHELGIGAGTPAFQTGRMLAALEPVLRDAAPELVLVYGDTNSTLAGAIAGAQAHVPVAHVEAGMRSFDRTMPEELNRILTDHASELLLCSTQTAVDNLANEGIARGVHLVGDAMADVALATASVARERRDVLDGFGVEPGSYVLVTAHRAGNVDHPARLTELVELLLALPRPVVFPVHPRTRARLVAAGMLERLEKAEGFHVSPPVGYVELLALAIHARAVATDSGGLQKEAYLVEVPCVTLRDTTEWVETVETGWNVLVDLNADAAVAALDRARPAEHPDLYGGGRAGERIRDAIDALSRGD